MATDYEMKIPAHKSIYSSSIHRERELVVYFSEPERGINSDTGIVLLIAGFGGNANSNVYKKMRREFADIYNLVAVQCDYFGYEFMQIPNKIANPEIDYKKASSVFTKDEMERIYKGGELDLDTLINIGKKYNHDICINAKADLSGESPEYFNDMGIIQAIDNITAVLSVMNILYNNDYNFNAKRIIVYGHSHGAYLSYLCNAFAPYLFTLLIDNSAWLFPKYFKELRQVITNIDSFLLNVYYYYFAANMEYDEELLDLNTLYSMFVNPCKIISYHGVTDNIISNVDKKAFCGKIEKISYYEVFDNNIDSSVFKSTNHGLGADFLRLFDFTFKNFPVEFEKDTSFYLPETVSIKTKKHLYTISYDDTTPRFRIS